MDPQKSKRFKAALNLMPVQLRFSAQVEYNLSENPEAFADRVLDLYGTAADNA